MPVLARTNWSLGRRFILISFLGLSVSAAMGLVGCSHAKKKVPELSQLEGKKVALVEIDAEATPYSVVEVALVNQLVKRGTFDLIPKEEIQKARKAPEQDPADWLGIARKCGADYGLKAKVLEFSAEERSGYSSEKVYDSQLAQERGEKEGHTEKLFKVKSLTAKVRIELSFTKTDPKDPDPRSAIAEAEETVKSEEKTEAAHLPPKLFFLEKLSNEAFNRFFEQYK